MDRYAQESEQTTQRVRVGMTGLASVLLLIGLASAVFSWASKETPVAVPGAARVDVVANMTATNSSDAASFGSNEPLAELGVAPSTATEDANASMAPAAGATKHAR